VARQYTIDQTETDRFEIPTIPTPTLMDPPAPPAPFSSDLPNVRPHRHRKPTWGTVWAQEIGRRDFRIYIMVLAVLSGGILGGVLILRTPTTPSGGTRNAFPHWELILPDPSFSLWKGWRRRDSLWQRVLITPGGGREPRP
jgi:hypothetical protein